MAWFGNLGSLGNLGDLAGAVNNLGDLAGAVNKISEGVKSIELNFDAALLGLEEKGNIACQHSRNRHDR